jgi:hypothetical protein
MSRVALASLQVGAQNHHDQGQRVRGVQLPTPEPKVTGSSPIGRTNNSTTYRDWQRDGHGVVPLWYHPCRAAELIRCPPRLRGVAHFPWLRVRGLEPLVKAV